MSTDTTPSENTSGSTPTYAPSSSATSFIDVSGGLLTEQTIQSLRQERFDHPAATPETFSLPNEEPQTNAALEEEIALTWEQLVERWDEVTQKGELFEMDVSDARNKWILKLFRALDFESVYQRALLSVSDLEFDLSHKGWPDEDIADYGEMAGARAPVLHTVEPPSGREIDLDSRPSGRGSRSPHDELQKFLNASPDQDWGIVTDGVHLRVLRDFYHTYTRGYVEFDLENIFESRNYQDFRALYRLCHASRFLPIDEGEPSRSTGEVVDEVDETDEADDVAIPLEMLYQTSLATGVKVGQDLQENVISTIETLGNGLLNPDIREFLREGGEAEAEEYYQEVLFVVYRLLFLLYAEQRGMMPGRDSLYTEEYSITALRERAERRRDTDDPNTDLWHGLQATFRLVEEGNDEMGVPCYNGMLFDSERLDHLSESACPNDALLSALADLTLIEREGVLQRISYADLGVEEVGSIYESLLEFRPRLAEEHIELDGTSISPGEFYLDDRGTERKETGSYYTDPQLVQELIKSALEPVVEDRLESADDTKEAQEAALLDITVCDPACGSAAFLIAATNYLGNRLAEIREGMEYPLEEDVREARRSVLQHCIYGVDRNPMAVELAKVSLWIDSAVAEKPLNFLDHRIKCGDSLLGATGELVEQGVPIDAYETSKKRDWHVGTELRKRVRNENSDYSTSNSQTLNQFGGGIEDYAVYANQLNEIEEESVDDIHKKERVYREFRDDPTYQREKLVYDIWTAAFFWPMDGSANEYPTPKTIEKIRKSLRLSDSNWYDILQHSEHTGEWSESDISIDTDLLDMAQRARQIAKEQRFFHWELEFSDVFSGADPGFDCILSNPPWETIKLQEKEFFASRNEEISRATKSERRELINGLEETDPILYSKYIDASRNSDNLSEYFRHSTRYDLSAKGDINYYPLFCEHNRWAINNRGKLGIITPTGIVTDYYKQDFVRELVSNRELESLYDFDNREGIFPTVEDNIRFSLLTLSGEEAEQITIACQLENIGELHEEGRIYTITPQEIEIVNPNTLTLPMFKYTNDAKLVLSLHNNTPILEETNATNTTNFDEDEWEVDFLRMFDMSTDSDSFKRPRDLESEQEYGRKITDLNDTYLPLLESKMCDQFTHRHATFEGIPTEKRYKTHAGTNKPSVEELQNPSWLPYPRYYVSEENVNDALEEYWDYEWLIGFRNAISAVADARSVKFSIIPRYGVGHSMPLVFTEYNSLFNCGVIANFNSFILDYVARQKASGGNLTYHILRQLPIVPPNRYSERILRHIVPRVLELSYTAWNLTSFADDIWNESSSEMKSEIEQQWHANADIADGSHRRKDAPSWVERTKVRDEQFPHPPFTWDTERRHHIRAQLDACYSHMYGMSNEDVGYLLDQFPIVKSKDEDEYGEYRTKRLILEYYDEYEGQFVPPDTNYTISEVTD